MPVPRLYLDWDGPVNAREPQQVWGSAVSGTFALEADGAPWSVAACWSPALIRALDSLVTDFGVEVVWLTSFCENDDIVERMAPELRGLASGRSLPYTGEDGSGLWKLEALAADQATAAPFIWADDVEVQAHGPAVRRLTPGTPSLLIAPNARVGLTPKHVEMMRVFLAGL